MWSDGLKKQFQGPPLLTSSPGCTAWSAGINQSTPTDLPTYLPTCLPTYLSTNLSIYLSIFTLHYGVNALPVLC